MARFSIRQLFIVIALVALLLAASGVILKSRWQQSEIDVLNYSLEAAWMERPILANAILQCDTNSKFSHLDMSNFLQSLAGNEFSVDLTSINYGTAERNSIILVVVTAEYPGQEYISKHGRSDLGRAALFVYDHGEHTVVDAMITEDYSGHGVFTGQANGYELDLGDPAVRIVATQNGFIALE